MAKEIRVRQEVLNTALAEILSERGIEASPERVLSQGGDKRMPDVMANLNGLRVIIECEVGGNPLARRKALASARERINQGIATIAVALVYPENLAAIADVRGAKRAMR